MNSNNARYGTRSNGLYHGDVFTSPEVVRFMLDTVGYISQSDLSRVNILEPSFGNGEFLIEIQHRIIESSKKYKFDPKEAFQKCVFACEIDEKKYAACTNRLRVLMPDYVPENLKNGDFLLTDWDVRFDIVVGNPPYVRYENIPADVREVYKGLFKTFHYRCDLYVLFYEHSLKFLAPAGRHCFICSNRWLKNEYGKKLRELIYKNYNFEKLIDVEKLDAFQESVNAYPGITVISNGRNKRTIATACIKNIQELVGVQYEYRTYSDYDDLNGVSVVDSHLNFPTIQEQGFSIGIGVATGADKIFITNDLYGKIEPELILPIISSKDLSGNRFQYSGLCLLNPYDQYGRLIDLDLFPKAKAYLEAHKATLQNRHIAKKNRVWYALIDKIKPDLLYKSKILLPDMSANTHIFVDNGRFYPAHNLYYITSDFQDTEQLSILAAFLMSDLVRHQVKRLSNNMNGGFPRWQSQVLKKLRLPCICDIDSITRMQLLSAYRNFDIPEINRIVNHIWLYSLPRSFVNYSGTQLSLFDNCAL